MGNGERRRKFRNEYLQTWELPTYKCIETLTLRKMPREKIGQSKRSPGKPLSLKRGKGKAREKDFARKIELGELV